MKNISSKKQEQLSSRILTQDLQLGTLESTEEVTNYNVGNFF